MAPHAILSADLAKLVEHYLHAQVLILQEVLDGFLRFHNIDQQNLKRFVLITLLQTFK
jgi:hypothetical protein